MSDDRRASSPYALPGTSTTLLDPSDGGAPYRILLAPPRDPPPDSGFPVLYLLDAGASFGMLVEMLRMRRNRSDVTGVGPALVVGIAHPDHHPYDPARRERDYTPGPREDAGYGPSLPPNSPPKGTESDAGGSEAFGRFLMTDLVPWVEGAYPADPEARTIIGHSLAGLFTLFTFLGAPASFRSYVAISPSLWWAPRALEQELDLLPSRLSAALPERRVMLAVGEYEQALAPWHRTRPDAESFARRREARRMVDGARALDQRLRSIAPSVETRLEVYPEGDHASVVPIALSRALRFVVPAGAVRRAGDRRSVARTSPPDSATAVTARRIRDRAADLVDTPAAYDSFQLRIESHSQHPGFMSSRPSTVPRTRLGRGSGGHAPGRASRTLARAGVFACTMLFASVGPIEAQTVVTDVSGRTVTLPAGPQRLLIDDGRYLLALSLLPGDPTARLVGWPHDAHRIGDETYRDFVTRFPRIAEIPRVSGSGGSFSLELALAVEPTVAVVTMGRGPTAAQVRALESAGVMVVFVDFVARPLENVDRSLEILGTLVGRRAEAEAFVAFRQERRRRIEERLASAAPDRPSVFVEAHAGLSRACCSSPGRGGLGEYIDLAGGNNIGAEVLPGAAGQLSLEYVIQRDPQVYVATGGPHVASAGGFVVGPGFTAAEARASLERMSRREGLRLVDAVRSGRVHGLAHQLLNSPLDIVALELLAVWLHPTLFADVDPAETLAEINRRFLAVPLEGSHWVVVR